MSAADVMICRIMLRDARSEARAKKVAIPKRLTALRADCPTNSYRKEGGWYLVEGDGFSKEIDAANAYDAKAKAIRGLINKAESAAEVDQ